MSILSCGVSFHHPIVSNCKSEALNNGKPRIQSRRILCLNHLKSRNSSNHGVDGFEFGVSRGKDKKRNNLGRLNSVVDAGEVAETSGSSVDSSFYDAIVIGSGIGGLVAATQLAVKGAKVLVLEKYVIPGGSSGFYEREGFTFDVGSSVMFGFSDKGNLNLITQALAAVGCRLQVIPDPTTVHFHLPNGLSVQVDREYSKFTSELISKFPLEKEDLQCTEFAGVEVTGGANLPFRPVF